jgi:hypothetical protein
MQREILMISGPIRGLLGLYKMETVKAVQKYIEESGARSQAVGRQNS